MRSLIGLLIAATIPTFAQTTFKIQSLGTPATQFREHYEVTGDSGGALAVSANSVYYNGDTATGQFGLDLLETLPAISQSYALVSDLKDGSVYEFINRAGSPLVDTRVTPANKSTRPLTHLKNIITGTAIGLSSPLSLSDDTAIFAGYGRVVIAKGTTIYDIALPSGAITQRTIPSKLQTVGCEQWLSWGIAEFFDNTLHLAYVENNHTISRTRVTDGQKSPILTTGGNGLTNMCSFSVLPARNRWYFQHSNKSDLGGVSPNGNDQHDEFIGYAPATFVLDTDTERPVTKLTPATESNTNGWYNTTVSVAVSAADTGGSGVKDTQCSINGGAYAIVGSSVTLISEGINNLTCFSTDKANNVETPAVTLKVQIDTAPPQIAFKSRTAPNESGWNNTNVIVDWSCFDTTSGAVSDTVSKELTEEGANQLTTGSCTDFAGNTATNQQSNINIDKSAPKIVWGAATPSPNAAGWNSSDVSVAYTVQNDLSGLTVPATGKVDISSEGFGVTGSVTLTDIAGNSAKYTTPTFNIDKTAPVITLTERTQANSLGWNNTDVIVTWSCSDATSKPVEQVVSNKLTTEGANQSTTGTCIDNAGNHADNAQSNINIDKTPPVITLKERTPANSLGWNNTDVIVTWSCSDVTSEPVEKSVSNKLDTEALNQSTTGTCTDKAGNKAEDVQSNINIDKTAPKIYWGTATPAPNAAGWNNSDVSVAYTVKDNLSGLAVAATGKVDISSEGIGVTGSVTLTDNAGNSAKYTTPALNIDKTAPVITLTERTQANSSGWNNTDVIVKWSCSDAISGPPTGVVSTVLSSEGANQSASGTCLDLASNIALSTVNGINIDKTAPSLPTAIVGTPNPVSVGTPLKITATVSDGLISGMVGGAEYQFENGSWMPLSAVDGVYSSPSENVSASTTAPSAAGVYDLCVRATDIAGNTGPAECIYVVVYDPNGGFVTGGGWIMSPAGAYRANTAITGKANFGFVSKYQKGANVPTGETQFDFKFGNLNFHSTVYEWLVVAGSKAQYKGSGNINGAGNYGFMLTAVDGKTSGGDGADKFRIKIWDKAKGDAIVYDNQLGSSDDSTPTTTLGGGSIVVHSK